MARYHLMPNIGESDPELRRILLSITIAAIAMDYRIAKSFPCNNCGAEAGHVCKPEYGCTNANRSKR